jgi:uncharacterized protein
MQDTPSPMARSQASIATAQAERYLSQLCKHFQHRRPVTFDRQSGHIAFDMGDCRLRAEAGVLTLVAEAPDAERLAQLQDVVARHLVRFAFREELRVAWSAPVT